MATRWLRSQTGASLVDQAAVSAGNFLTTLVLARTLAPADYGAFSLLFLALFALNTCHSSLIIYPLTLRGAKIGKSELGELTGAALIHTLLLGLPLSLVLLLIAISVHRIDLYPYLLAAMLFWQLQETVRRALLCALRFSDAILPDAICYLGQALVIFLLHSKELRVVFLVVAATSLLAALWQAVLVSVRGLRSLSREHAGFSWSTGRYILAGNALNMVALQWPSWTLLAASGAVVVADYQSLLSLAGFANPIIFSINSLLIPIIAREEALGIQHARLTAVRYGARFGALLVPPFVLLLLLPWHTMRLVYGAASPYLAFAPMLRLMVSAFCVQYVATVVGAYEGGRGRPKSYMWSQIVSIAVLLTAGTALMWTHGVAGAALTMVLVSLVRLVSFVYISWSADHAPLQLVVDPMDASR
jgi:O-antigen/teichoic acid export membrane protein